MKLSFATDDWTMKQLMAEFIAMMLFVWIGTGSAVSSSAWTIGSGEAGQLLTISIAFGIGISVLAYGIGHISGGHINPAVTFAFVLLGDKSVLAGALYILAQLAGAVVGSFVVWGCSQGMQVNCDNGDVANGVCASQFITPSGEYGPAFSIGLNQVSDSISIGSAFFLELVGTYLLVFTVLHSAVHSASGAANAAPIAIGWSVLLAHINLIPFTGCGINPARSFGPMIVDSIGGLSAIVWIRGWWIYYTAPFVGSLLATLTYYFVLKDCDAPPSKEGEDNPMVAEPEKEMDA